MLAPSNAHKSSFWVLQTMTTNASPDWRTQEKEINSPPLSHLRLVLGKKSTPPDAASLESFRPQPELCRTGRCSHGHFHVGSAPAFHPSPLVQNVSQRPRAARSVVHSVKTEHANKTLLVILFCEKD